MSKNYKGIGLIYFSKNEKYFNSYTFIINRKYIIILYEKHCKKVSIKRAT